MIELFEEYVRWKILSHFLANPGTAFHVKGLARLLKVSPASVSSTAKSLHSDGILLKEERGIAHFYKLNMDHYLTPTLKKAYGIALITELKPEVEFLEIDPDITSMALFGSYADGSFDEKSDVDVLIITPNKKRELLDVAARFSDELGHKVGLYIFKPSQWRSMVHRSDEFYRWVMRDYLLLHGSKLE